MKTIGEIEELIIMLKKHNVANYHSEEFGITFSEGGRAYAPLTEVEPEGVIYEGKEESEKRINLELFGRQ